MPVRYAHVPAPKSEGRDLQVDLALRGLSLDVKRRRLIQAMEKITDEREMGRLLEKLAILRGHLLGYVQTYRRSLGHLPEGAKSEKVAQGMKKTLGNITYINEVLGKFGYMYTESGMGAGPLVTPEKGVSAGVLMKPWRWSVPQYLVFGGSAILITAFIYQRISKTATEEADEETRARIAEIDREIGGYRDEWTGKVVKGLEAEVAELEGMPGVDILLASKKAQLEALKEQRADLRSRMSGGPSVNYGRLLIPGIIALAIVSQAKGGPGDVIGKTFKGLADAVVKLTKGETRGRKAKDKKKKTLGNIVESLFRIGTFVGIGYGLYWITTR